MTKQIGNSDLLDTWGATGDVVEPSGTKKDTGWEQGERPPHEYMNWIQNVLGQAVNHVLKNGVPVWNSATEYAAGAAVQYNGNLWRAQATNTNSQPSDANSNWQRMLSLEDSDGRYARRANNLSDLDNKATAFANIKQAATTSATGVVELATNTETQTGTDSDRAVTPAGLSSRSATTARTGLVEKATTAESQSGTADKFPDAAGVKAHWDQRAASAESISGAWDFINGVWSAGNLVLDTSDLAANGGNVVTDDRTNTFGAAQQIAANSLFIWSSANPRVHLIDEDNPPGSLTQNYWAVENVNGTFGVRQLDTAGTNIDAALICTPDRSVVVGTPTGGSQGPGTINAEAFYQNGKRIGPIEEQRLVAHIDSDGTILFQNGNGSVSINKTGIGAYTVTHNLGTTDYAATATVDNTDSTTSSRMLMLQNKANNDIRVRTRDETGAAVDSAFFINFAL